MKILNGRIIKDGYAEGVVLKSEEPISFFGGVDPRTSEIIDRTHPLFGKKLKDTIFVFPKSVGSTVGSYVLYQLFKNGLAPKALIIGEVSAIDAAGAIISDILCIDKIDIKEFKTGMVLKIRSENNAGIIEILG